MRKLILLIILILIISGCSNSDVPQTSNYKEQGIKTSDSEFVEEVLGIPEEQIVQYPSWDSLVWSVPMLLFDLNSENPNHILHIEKLKTNFSENAWNSYALHYLMKHRSLWHEPAPIEVSNIRIFDKDVIRGILRINLIPASSVLDKPALLEFEVAKTPNGWIFNSFGKLIIRSSYPLQLIEPKWEDNYIDTNSLLQTRDSKKSYGERYLSSRGIVITINNGVISAEEMTPEEFIWYVMFYDEIDEYGLGMINFLQKIFLNEMPADKWVSLEVQLSNLWPYLKGQSSKWSEGTWGLQSFELVDKNQIIGTIILQLPEYPFTKKYFDFLLIKTENNWQFKSFSISKFQRT